MARIIPIKYFITSYETGNYEESDPAKPFTVIRTYHTQCALPQFTCCNGVCFPHEFSADDVLAWISTQRGLFGSIQNQNICNMFADWLWSSGSEAVSGIEDLLGVKTAKSHLSGETISALNAANPSYLFEDIRKTRLRKVDEILRANPKLRKFEAGWYRRINAIGFGYLVDSQIQRITW